MDDVRIVVAVVGGTVVAVVVVFVIVVVVGGGIVVVTTVVVAWSRCGMLTRTDSGVTKELVVVDLLSQVKWQRN